jgi:RNA-binding protein
MAMRALTSREKKSLRGLAHALEPRVHIGKAGLTEAVLGEIDQQLDRHELVKVKFLAGKDEKHALCDALAGDLDCAVAGVVGHIGILYRQNEDPDDRVVDFPNLHPSASD